MKKILIGKVIKPQGIKGEIKVLPLTDTPEVFANFKNIYLEDIEYKVLSARIADGVFIVLRGIADRNAAEELRNKNLYVEKSAIQLPENRWFVEDVMKCSVYLDNGLLLGGVIDISTRGSTDIYTVQMADGTVSFPLLKDLICEMDIENKKIILKSKRFNEVSLYEN